jgi:hypothetical protein
MNKAATSEVSTGHNGFTVTGGIFHTVTPKARVKYIVGIA